MNGEHDNGADTTQGEVHTPQPGPGSRLAKARVAANLSVEQVAASLNLTTGVVKALERDDAEQLPAPVFVRGYIRNYARLVGLRDEELVSQFENTRAPDVPLELRPRPASEAPRMHRGVSARAVMAVLLLVGAGSVAWWWAQGGRIDVAVRRTGPTVPGFPTCRARDTLECRRTAFGSGRVDRHGVGHSGTLGAGGRARARARTGTGATATPGAERTQALPDPQR
jgi:cytoskeleton protein RodZ